MSVEGSRISVVAAAAKKYGVPLPIMYGVWGMETDFGQLVNTSSAGAVGEFQFIPGTAAQYHYPLTNKPNDQQFQQQADSAAHLLSDLFHKTHNWNTALHGYSGGGYGLAQVESKAKGFMHLAGTATVAAPGPLKPFTDVATAAGNVASAIGSIGHLLTSGDFWLALGAGLLGGLLLLIGAFGLTGAPANPVTAARRVVPV